ncbi:MAG: 5-formyltetrahydrofolate cyclo-ligase [Candidatus Nezhaarchaeota archaeon]|nr:5-formyltetrahydrofolate cyclo-ligase [Candidatus Nezhaarchaeota archaeon]MCX8141179.1 5-formyltetrahydrofolate cyclo-ligase [Candidatus Nezhaarchaeota archaeon]MDW8050818.1 5-formyltetrahydrofolate cyclo-ligase [Nitrososphaerota archaeon]
MTSISLKDKIRMDVWRAMMEKNVALPPFPIYGRIPNFKGAEEAALKLRSIDEYVEAEVVLCNPDSPQRALREMVLRDGKILIVATPRLSRGFVALHKPKDAAYASTIKGFMELGRPVKPGDYRVDVFVAGSVAVSLEGHRLGKGTGFSDIEYKLWSNAGSITDETLRVTTVHDIQVVYYVPRDEWDVPVDLILTPTRILWTAQAKRFRISS